MNSKNEKVISLLRASAARVQKRLKTMPLRDHEVLEKIAAHIRKDIEPLRKLRIEMEASKKRPKKSERKRFYR